MELKYGRSIIINSGNGLFKSHLYGIEIKIKIKLKRKINLV